MNPQSTAKKKSNDSIYKSFKIPLKRLLLTSENQLLFHQLVIDMDNLVIHAYQFIRLYTLSCFEEKTLLPIIDKSFILDCLRLLSLRDPRGRSAKVIPALTRFYENVYQPLVNHQKLSIVNKSYILTYIATDMESNYKNVIEEHFVQHFARFLKLTTSHLTKDAYQVRTFRKHCLLLKDTDLMFEPWVKEHLGHILPSNIEKSVHYDVKKQPFSYLKGMLYMNKILEQQGSRLFQPLPLRTNLIPKHILLDTSSLIDLFTPRTNYLDQRVTKSYLFNHVKENKHHVWSHIFNLNHSIFKHKDYEFDYQIRTDGFSCSLLFIHKDQIKKYKQPSEPMKDFLKLEDLTQDQLDDFKKYNIVGCDPGKHDLVYMIDEMGQKVHYTAAQRRVESYHKQNQQILLDEKKKHQITEKETTLSSSNSKTVDVEKFKKYLVEKDQLNRETQEFYQREVWRKMKFRSFSYSKKSLDKLLNKIRQTFGEKILIGYGNWSRNTQLKGILPTMNKGIRRIMEKHFDVVTVNESYTSQKCHVCHEPLIQAKDRQQKKIYRLFECTKCASSENKSNVFRSRDHNAAINIRNLTRYWIYYQKRPETFCYQASLFTSEAKGGLSSIIGCKHTS